MANKKIKKSAIVLTPELTTPAITEIVEKKRVGNATARRAAQILVGKQLGFALPTPKQKKNIVVAFVKSDMIVYGRAFDIIKLLAPVELDDLSEVEAKLNMIQLFEIKSTNKDKINVNFRGYFFGLTAAEVLVAQSLKQQFKFALVNTLTKHHVELSLNELFGRAKGIYPTWSILL
jgi:hypothetical protein